MNIRENPSLFHSWKECEAAQFSYINAINYGKFFKESNEDTFPLTYTRTHTHTSCCSFGSLQPSVHQCTPHLFK